ncbi:hypothetical protein MNBD_CHLOROFLEXI01-1059, partial [hydrothermal vent metagenome]
MGLMICGNELTIFPVDIVCLVHLYWRMKHAMRINRLFSVFVLLLVILVACREDQPLPTAVPTVTLPTAVPTNTPIATDSGTETAVATPAPIQIDPADIDWSPQLIY